MSDVFISYAHKDQATALIFSKAFEAAGLDVWWDPRLRAGEIYVNEIEAALNEAKAVVVLWSPDSVMSQWVRAEATEAESRKVLVPATIRPCKLPILFALTQTPDLSHWKGDANDAAWQGFLSDVRRKMAASAKPTVSTIGAAPAPAVAQPCLVLVQPFANMNKDPEQDFFSDGLSRDVMTDLGKVSALSVVARPIAFKYKGKPVPAKDIARLKITHILEGSVTKAANELRITAQLFDAVSNMSVWDERFDRAPDGAFAVQSEISKAIVDALKLHLAPKERKAIEQHPASKSEAYKLYLMARQFTRTGSQRHAAVIIRICEKAIKIDATFARAWAWKAMAEAEMHQVMGDSRDGRKAGERAIEAAERAVSLDPGLAEIHGARSIVLARASNNHEALKSSARALALDPDCYEAHVGAGGAHLGLRNYKEAVKAFEQAILLDPDAYWPAGMVIQAYQGLGETAKAREAATRSFHRIEKIIAAEPDHGAAMGFGANALITLGEKERALEWIGRAHLVDPNNARLHYNLACASARMGEPEAALDLLESIVKKLSKATVRWMGEDNDLDSLRQHPRFVALTRKARARVEDLEDDG